MRGDYERMGKQVSPSPESIRVMEALERLRQVAEARCQKDELEGGPFHSLAEINQYKMHKQWVEAEKRHKAAKRAKLKSGPYYPAYVEAKKQYHEAEKKATQAEKVYRKARRRAGLGKEFNWPLWISSGLLIVCALFMAFKG